MVGTSKLVPEQAIVAKGIVEGVKSSFCQTELLPTRSCFLVLVMKGLLLMKGVSFTAGTKFCPKPVPLPYMLNPFYPGEHCCFTPCSVPKTFTAHLRNETCKMFSHLLLLWALSDNCLYFKKFKNTKLGLARTTLRNLCSLTTSFVFQ